MNIITPPLKKKKKIITPIITCYYYDKNNQRYVFITYMIDCYRLLRSRQKSNLNYKFKLKLMITY